MTSPPAKIVLGTEDRSMLRAILAREEEVVVSFHENGVYVHAEGTRLGTNLSNHDDRMEIQ